MAILFIACIGFVACKRSADISTLEVTLRLPNEPESLHPIFSKSLYAAQIESLILLPLAEYDPQSLTLSPLLLSRIPEPEIVIDGENKKGKVYHLEFRAEATWSDGTPVTGEDYLFTFKSVYNPHLNTDSWRSFMNFVSDIRIDPDDPKKVAVYVDSSYILALEATTNFNIYPAHIYDSENLMRGFTLAELRDKNKVMSAEQDSMLRRFAIQYESPEFFRETVTGSGAYELDTWVTGEYIRLKRKETWWGDKLQDPPLLLQAYPAGITYRIILDAAAAEAALKAGEIDVMAEVPVSNFQKLKTDTAWKDRLQFATPALMQVNYIEVNNRHPVLADARIRQALAYTIDYDGILTQVLQGLASRTVGPIHPDKSYYHRDLVPLQQDIKKAIELIREAGWEDTNGNGIPDKDLQGKRTELQLSIKVTNKEEGMAIANIVKDNASRAGFKIDIVVVDPSQLQQDIRQTNFELLPIRVRAFPSLDDPFPIWHSSNDRPGGSNRSGFKSIDMDGVIEQLRAAKDEETRDRLYLEFQEIIYREQPAIFLYVPLERIIASKRIDLKTSPRRPGYFENLMRPAGS